MSIKIALAGNPNCGKTTIFRAGIRFDDKPYRNRNFSENGLCGYLRGGKIGFLWGGRQCLQECSPDSGITELLRKLQKD